MFTNIPPEMFLIKNSIHHRNITISVNKMIQNIDRFIKNKYFLQILNKKSENLPKPTAEVKTIASLQVISILNIKKLTKSPCRWLSPCKGTKYEHRLIYKIIYKTLP